VNSALEKQVAMEAAAIKNAQPVAYGATIPTCHFCGRILPEPGKRVELVDGAERFIGGCCGHAD
jgi:hypothetical protein